jgi:phosphoribosyl 1,2-cyclic phosphate phosphodiesterase
LPFEVRHGTWSISGFRIGRLGYITDASYLPPASADCLHELDVLVINALRIQTHPTHFSIDEARQVVDQLRPRRALLVHMTHDIDHQTVNATLPEYLRLAYDGQAIEVEEYYHPS